MRPLVVAHVVRSLEVGGLENGVVNVANAGASDIRHVIVCLRRVGALRARLAVNVDLVSLDRGEGHDVMGFVRLVRLLRRLGPVIVHSRNWTAFDAIPAARLAGVPLIVHGEHGRDIVDPEGRNHRRNRLRRLFAPLVDRMVTVSDDLRRWLVDRVRIPTRKVMTIHNGVDVRRFRPGEPTAARAALGLPIDSLVVGTVGRLDPVKGQADLLRAFSRVRGHNRRAILVVVGDGPCRDELIALSASLGLAGHVHLLGERHDIPRILQALDTFVLPSIAEGISNTLLEAMASGLPVVATRVGGNPELVDDGVSGILVPPRDQEALAEAVGAYLRDPGLRALHGASARQRTVACFSLERMTSSYLALYRQLTAHRFQKSA